MSIIIDCNQISISNIMMSLKIQKDVCDPFFIRHMILNSIRLYNKKFKSKYGDMIICYDGQNNWRKEIFQYYKSNRSVSRKKSTVDWNELFDVLNMIENEIREVFYRYKVLKFNRYEADDIIASLCKDVIHPSLIISSDKDFGQLHKNKYVNQYDPIRNKFIDHSKDWKEQLLELIINGDKSDGVPNIFSDDDCMVMGKRQTPNTVKRRMELSGTVESLMTHTREELLDIMKITSNDNYKRIIRNILMIDLSKIPKELNELVNDSFGSNELLTGIEASKQKCKIRNYLLTNKLTYLFENIKDF